ncbi:MAG: hypothetical protein GFH27_549333n100 [Chloroflexi bacterium AL-W]|nr:hypothetical protein [Chloroflexi bacterium AL-N1]NOK70447.1 hypothetical protein [Chloroflexi bacterium AL-N10]NOK78194.1 hypothetical protein [Chloroflexi bacterium AL-N5]NOK85293.1 hypothetical protein [Chloroflexi bacterium AL-W]NOK92058.1 hypothetical protein [Chloroflexi bacterium AL-N15]
MFYKSFKEKVTFTILCGLADLGEQSAQRLENLGYTRDIYSSIEIILDAPSGFAITVMTTAAKRSTKQILITSNQCPEYCEDLWEFASAILLVNPTLDQDVADAIDCAYDGQSYRIPYPMECLLTVSQRRILRLLACGFTHKEIAATCNVKPQSVSNTISQILSQLYLSNRVEATLYYWGLWHLVESIKYPER